MKTLWTFGFIACLTSIVVAVPRKGIDMCGYNGDLIFLVDTSSSIGYQSMDNWYTILAFVSNITHYLQIGQNATCVGIIQYSDKAINQMFLKDTSSQTDLETRIKKLRYYGGLTNTGEALKLLRNTAFTIHNGDRPSSPNVAVIITDGNTSGNRTETVMQANEVHRLGIKVFAVGITKTIDDKELAAISSPPHKVNSNYFHTPNFQALQAIVDGLETQICGFLRSAKESETRVDHIGIAEQIRLCPNNGDLVFFIDSSSRGDFSYYQNWHSLLEFISDVSQMFRIGAAATRVAILEYPSSGSHMTLLRDTWTSSDLTKRINNMKWGAVSSRIDADLSQLFEEAFSLDSGNRKEYPDIAVFLLDTWSYLHKESVLPLLQMLQQSGVQVFTVGVNKAWEVDLSLGSSPLHQKGATYFLSPSYYWVMKTVGEQICLYLESQKTGAQGENVAMLQVEPDGEEANSYNRSGGHEERNSHQPKFHGEPYTAHVKENTIPGGIITSVFAFDEDQGPASRITYSLSPESNPFSINSTLGIIYQNSLLDREKKDQYILEVTAADSGIPPRSSTAYVIIYIDDVNDNTPQFTLVHHDVVLPENTPIGTEVLVLEANDADAGFNAEIQYLMSTQYNGKDKFLVEHSTGRLFLIEPLNQREANYYRLYVIAKDRGSPSLSASAAIDVYVGPAEDGSSGNDSHLSDFPKCPHMVDLVFMIDVSDSIQEGTSNWNLLKQFTMDLANHFNIGPSSVRVGVMVFGIDPEHIFFLKDTASITEITNALHDIPYHGGLTNTAKALKALRKGQFSVANGNRINIPNIAVVITHGQADIERYRLTMETILVHASQILVFVVGVTSEADDEELKVISSKPHREGVNYFKAATFEDLHALLSHLQSAMCEYLKNNVERDRHTERTTQQFTLSPSYLTSLSNERPYSDKRTQGITSILTTASTEPLEETERMKSIGNNTTHWRQYVASSGTSRITSTATAEKQSDIMPYSTSVPVQVEESAATSSEIIPGVETTSSPLYINTNSGYKEIDIGEKSKEYTKSTITLLTLQDHSDHTGKKTELMTTDQRESSTLFPMPFTDQKNELNGHRDCRNLDLVFLIDGSGSVRFYNRPGTSNWDLIKNSLKHTVEFLSLQWPGARMAVILFSSDATMVSQLTTASDMVKKDIDRMEYPGGQTNTAAAIKMMREDIFRSLAIGRKRHSILITDGRSLDPSRTKLEAQWARDLQEIELCIVGVKNELDEMEIHDLSSFPHKANKNYFIIDTYGELQDILDTIISITCEQ